MDKRQKLADLLCQAERIADSIGDELRSDPAARAQCIEASKQLTRKLQGSLEVAQEVFHAPFNIACLQTALDAGWLLGIERSGEDGNTVESLATLTGADVSLVRQICRYLAANGSLREAGPDRFVATPLTSLLCTKEEVAAGLRHAGHTYVQAAARMPEFFSSNGYSRPANEDTTPYAFAQGMSFWEALAQRPGQAQAFNTYMSAKSLGRKQWFEMFPVKEKLRTSPDEVMLIDIGGGKGHELAPLAQQKGGLGLEGKLVLQDLAKVIEAVPEEWRTLFEAQPHDFFQPQPGKYVHARAYYMRFVLHDWNDEKCVEMLRHIRDAMKPGYSMLLINELVLPNSGCSADAASLDMVMMSVMAGRERTRTEWEALIGQVGGLKMQQIWSVSPMGHGIIEVSREE